MGKKKRVYLSIYLLFSMYCANFRYWFVLHDMHWCTYLLFMRSGKKIYYECGLLVTELNGARYFIKFKSNFKSSIEFFHGNSCVQHERVKNHLKILWFVGCTKKIQPNNKKNRPILRNTYLSFLYATCESILLWNFAHTWCTRVWVFTFFFSRCRKLYFGNEHHWHFSRMYFHIILHLNVLQGYVTMNHENWN